MHNDQLKRMAAINDLINMLEDERDFIASTIKPSGSRDKLLRSVAEAISSTGFNRESIQSDKWAGIIVMSAVLGKVSQSEDDRQSAKKVLREIVAAGHLSVQSEYSTRRGRGLPVYVLRESSHL